MLVKENIRGMTAIPPPKLVFIHCFQHPGKTEKKAEGYTWLHSSRKITFPFASSHIKAKIGELTEVPVWSPLGVRIKWERLSLQD